MDKAVADSNILVSSFIVKAGVPNQIIRQSGRTFILYTCEAILSEAERILRTDRIRKKYRFTDDELAEYLAGFHDSNMAEMVTDLPVVDVIQDDPTDNVILACAEKAEANFIITGDQHLLSLKEFGQAKIVTPREFLTIHPGQI
jgi:hypothetical protein